MPEPLYLGKCKKETFKEYCQEGNLQEVKNFLKQFPSFDLFDSETNFFADACRSTDKTVAYFLLTQETPTKKFATGKENNLALQFAIQAGDHQLVDTILGLEPRKNGLDFTVPGNRHAALWRAALTNDTTMWKKIYHLVTQSGPTDLTMVIVHSYPRIDALNMALTQIEDYDVIRTAAKKIKKLGAAYHEHDQLILNRLAMLAPKKLRKNKEQ
jgi:hypothetical protein